MADMIETLKNLIGDDAENKLGSVMNALNSNNTQEHHMTLEQSNAGINSDLLFQAQNFINQLSSAGGDTRSNLLISLKPYMRQSRRNSIDQAVKLLNLAQLSQLFKGGI